MAYLQETPYVVEIAENGAIALEKFIAGAFDLVLMDRQMPVMDGLTATRAMRAWEQANHRPADADHRADGIRLEGRPGEIRCGRMHGVSDEADQARHAAARRSGSTPRTAPAASDDQATARTACSSHVNPKLADLIPGFLQNRRHDVVAMLAALDAG
jgi:CheY-like chemotaxis protein